MNFSESAAFCRDLKHYAKKWRTLPKDIEVAKRVISSLYTPQEFVDIGQFRRNFFDGKTAAIIMSTNDYEVIKMRLDCSSPGAQGKTRLVFIFVVAKEQVTLLELYSKSDKNRENEERILRFISTLSDDT